MAIVTAARALRIYEPIRVTKDRVYRTLRDHPTSVRCGTRYLLGRSFAEAAPFCDEFDRERFPQKIDERIRLEARKDPNCVAGTSSPLNLRMLYALCRMLKPGTVVETGVASGASSWVILEALRRNGSGRLHSIDLPAADDPGKDYRALDRVRVPAGRQPGWLVPWELRGAWELILGDARRELPPLLERLKTLDLFYHDAEHTREAMLFEFKSAWPRLSSGGALSSDDVSWNSAFREFYESVGIDARSWFSFGLARKP